MKKNGIITNCAFCHKEMYRPLWSLKRAKNIFCGVDCKQQWLKLWLKDNFTGEKHPRFKQRLEREKTEEQNRILCGCGCGVRVPFGRMFLNGHNLRVNNPMKRPEIALKVSKKSKGRIPWNYNPNLHTKEERLCDCGCNQIFKVMKADNQRYIHGHNFKIELQKQIEQGREDRTCPNCSKAFNIIKSDNRVCCSRYCADKYSEKETYKKYLKKCPVCQKEFSNKYKRCCSVTCAGQLRRKKKQDFYYSSEYKEWRSMVFGRDHYTCQFCDGRGRYLEAHHIYKFTEYPELGLMISNGITLCLECHNKTKGREHLYIDKCKEILYQKEGYIDVRDPK